MRIIDALCAAVAARGAGGALTVPLFFLLWSRLRRIAARATKAAARIAAGVPRPATRPRAPRPPRPQPLRLPRGFAWVVRVVPGTAAYGTQLQALLADPDMAALAEDPRLRRLLNPLRQMLGVPPPPAPARAAPPRPPPPARDSGDTTPAHDPPPLAAPLAA